MTETESVFFLMCPSNWYRTNPKPIRSPQREYRSIAGPFSENVFFSVRRDRFTFPPIGFTRGYMVHQSLDGAQQTAQLRAMRREDPSVIDVTLSCSYAEIF